MAGLGFCRDFKALRLCLVNPTGVGFLRLLGRQNSFVALADIGLGQDAFAGLFQLKAHFWRILQLLLFGPGRSGAPQVNVFHHGAQGVGRLENLVLALWRQDGQVGLNVCRGDLRVGALHQHRALCPAGASGGHGAGQQGVCAQGSVRHTQCGQCGGQCNAQCVHR